METTTELTREQRDKRVAVARDVLKQLDRADMRLKVRHNSYLSGPSFRGSFGGGSLQSYVDELQQHCEVCMLGAAFLSYTRLYNGVETGVIYSGERRLHINGSDMRPHLETIFDARTLDLMESVFEKCVMTDEEITDELREAAEFGDSFESPHDAARAIAQNIVDHDGEFILPPTP